MVTQKYSTWLRFYTALIIKSGVDVVLYVLKPICCTFSLTNTCYTQADTIPELLEKIKEVVLLCLEVERDIPPPNRFIGVQQMEITMQAKNHHQHPNMEVVELGSDYREVVNSYIDKEWGNPIVTRGNIIEIFDLPGFVAIDIGGVAGAILYQIKDNECEIVVLYSLKQNVGVGTKLINEAIEIAKENACKRIWLITMNDNTHAIRYYQRRGFSLKAVHINAFKNTQLIKGLGEDSLILGIDDIPILHEFEFEIIL
jgi:GNAT superfamily N-acetyltransferase